MSVEPLIKIENVSYTHWNRETPTLKGVSLQVFPATLNVLVGPGGSGKSTLCSLFNGEIPHLLGGEMEGTVFVKGQDTREAEVKDLSRVAGHMFQDSESMFATLYTEDELAFGPENLKLDPIEIRSMVDRLLVDFQLEPQRKNLVWNLSGGQIQKLGLAVILAMQPEMVVLDEPTANLDPQATRAVHELVLELRSRGIAILLVTRELDDFLLEHADQLLVLDDGHITAAGPVQQVLLSHGDAMHSLGIWLPETVEIGLGLRQKFGIKMDKLPINVTDTLAALRSHKLLGDCLGEEIPSTSSKRTNQAEALISGRGLEYSYANGFKALKGVSFEVYPGEMLAIVGRNGAGKSTLAKLMVGLQKPQSGDLQLFGKPARSWKVESLAENIALVFQNPEHQFLTDTAYDEIAYSLLARGITDPQEVKRLVEAQLEQLELTEFTKSHPFALSAGMKRRLGVATMLVCHPRLLLVDEPTYGQDRQMTHTLMALMEEIRTQGVSVVMITHDMRLVQEFASRVIVMSEGLITYCGDPSELFASEELLHEANLRPTLLQDLLAAYEAQNGKVNCPIHTSDDFLNALAVPQGRKAAHEQR
jgi:energy-coupling factor transport system ATP-binding protein